MIRDYIVIQINANKYGIPLSFTKFYKLKHIYNKYKV